jgi:aryl-alcohol dehydrogenase-like predicted oxidoreductase
MRTVEAAPGVRSSALGFGCAPILGSVGGRRAEAALGLALELGVTHLDVAPSYGFGEAEGWLGRFLRGRRDGVVLATKFGLEATGWARLLAPVKPVVRLFKGEKRSGAEDRLRLRLGLGNREEENQAARGGSPGRFFRRVEMSAANLERSVERSLRALRTDRIDVLLLHEPPGKLPAWGELRAAAERLKKAGKIRAFGAAYYRGREHPGEEVLRECDVRQFDASPAAEDYGRLVAEAGGWARILFSPFAGAGPGADRGEMLGRLFRDFPKSVVLCTMFSEEHIRRNAAVAGK